jgi:spore coat polysaccharide biosynthesis predicted glycosyltransferase SpsG/CMP-N-acetylneuraminic acid synthetase
MKDVLIVIPAIKKNAVIPDQLIKKLNGITLIQRAINTALKLANNKNQILIITDSGEITLIAQRNKIAFKKDQNLSLNSENIIKKVLLNITDFKQKNILLYRANTPLINSDDLKSAYQRYLGLENSMLVSVKKEIRNVFLIRNSSLIKEIQKEDFCEEIGAFYIFNKYILDKNDYNRVPYFITENKSIEIKSYQNWWICEKILQRKKIVFHVFGDIKIGMGHIFHSLSLAHEITDHEVVFVCNKKYELAVKQIASMDYKVISTENVEREIIALQPDLLVNDVLNTRVNFIKKIKKNGTKVVNFEDLGEGGDFADMVFNELYENPIKNGNHFYWGHKYLTLRDEFDNAKPNSFHKNVSEVLIMFGGSDQNNASLKTLQNILSICIERNILINIVCGGGYLYKDELLHFISKSKYKKIRFHYAIKNISEIMERSQVAISSNGRSIYELAEINIPSIVISHHEREFTHDFAELSRGFINVGVYSQETNLEVKKEFLKLVDDDRYRLGLFKKISQFSFINNKKHIITQMLRLIK